MVLKISSRQFLIAGIWSKTQRRLKKKTKQAESKCRCCFCLGTRSKTSYRLLRWGHRKVRNSEVSFAWNFRESCLEHIINATYWSKPNQRRSNQINNTSKDYCKCGSDSYNSWGSGPVLLAMCAHVCLEFICLLVDDLCQRSRCSPLSAKKTAAKHVAAEDISFQVCSLRDMQQAITTSHDRNTWCECRDVSWKDKAFPRCLFHGPKQCLQERNLNLTWKNDVNVLRTTWTVPGWNLTCDMDSCYKTQFVFPPRKVPLQARTCLRRLLPFVANFGCRHAR